MNMAANMILQMIVFLSGVILPRFFLEAYGSTVNGMVTSVNQFLVYLGLAEAGVGTASIVALYEPLAKGNKGEVSSIISATNKYYYKTGGLFLGLAAILTAVYPLMITQQLDVSFVRGMVLVLASSMLVDYFFIGKYKVLLTAAQKGYVVVTIQSIGTVINMLVTIGLIMLGCNALVVKAVATGVYILRFFAVRWYVKKEFSEIDFHAVPNMGALKQRNAALLHQVVGVIVNNTDVALLTVMLGKRSLLEVSVYGIYNMVVASLNMLLNSFSNGLMAGFGEIISKKETETLRKGYSTYEYMYFVILFIIGTCMGVLLLPFITVYTKHMTDADYIRPLLAIMFTAIIFLQNIRIPALTIICAVGHYKETKRQAILEAMIHIAVSLLLIKPFGIAGALTGTICSYGYRSIEVIAYNAKYLVPKTGSTTAKRLVRNTITTVCLIMIGLQIVPQEMNSFYEWFAYGMLTGTISVIVIGGLNFMFEPKEFFALLDRLKSVIKR